MKTFKGRLETTDGNRSSAALTIDPTALTIHVGDERVGSWEFDAIEVRRTASDRFTFDLANERVVFIANDPIDFAYTVPGWVAGHKTNGRKSIRRRLDARKATLIERIEQSGGRRRTRKLARSNAHVHAWKEQILTGGLIRRICADCGHVSIDLREAGLPEEIAPDAHIKPASA